MRSCDRCGGLNHTFPNCRYKDVHAESVVKSVTLNVFVVVLRLKDRHNESGDVHSEDVPLILVMEEGGVRAGS